MIRNVRVSVRERSWRASDVRAVERALFRIPGILEFSVNPASGEVYVRYESSFRIADVIAALEESGLHPEPVG